MSEERNSGWLREVRHNPCLMNPIAAIMMLILVLVGGITMLFHLPGVFLGLLVSPLARRSAWFIEFLYPSGIARWGHFFLVKAALKSKYSNGHHSRTIEQRVEVVKGRVYIHMLPQLLDNIAYLVVCVPAFSSNCTKVVCFLVDGGDAASVLEQVFEIRDVHYTDYQMDLQTILNTHKHHDHTGGNRGLLASDLIKVQQICGGAVEKVPYCNTKVKNGDTITLPAVDGNDMNDVVEVEVMAVPAHTRGSVVYALRTKTDDVPCFMFTGDTMFSGGGGVPFEADVETKNDQRHYNKTGSSPVKPSTGSKAVERCFAEILYRCRGSYSRLYGTDFTARMLVFPGHEYTSDLINRQFRSGAGDTSNWSKMPPAVFFETASQYYVASHRRALPHAGKLLTVPSLIKHELYINPHFRSLKKRGEHFIRAVRVWHRHFCKHKIDEYHNISSTSTSSSDYVPKLNKTASTENQWNVSPDDVSRPIFATVYSVDLDTVIEDLASNRITPQEAAKRLKSLQATLEDDTIRRRPIPGTLPTEKSVYQGIMALAILGSGPCAMTYADSQAMNLPPPMDHKSDRIKISKKRLLSVLNGLELLTAAHDGGDTVQMIELLWRDASEYDHELHEAAAAAQNGHSAEDGVENGHSDTDELELGVLKWSLYGAEANQPTWFSKFCMPCGSHGESTATRKHPVHTSTMRRTGGELVRHDVLNCRLCRDAAGCPDLDEPKNEMESPVKSEDRSTIYLTNSIEVELPKSNEQQGSLPFDEDESEHRHIEMRAVIMPLLTEA